MSRPICSYSSGVSSSWGPVAFAPPANTASAPARSCLFQAGMRVGWTPNGAANSSAVRPPRTAAGATGASNAAVWVFRFAVIGTTSESRPSS